MLLKIISMLEIPNNYNVTSSNINRGEIIEESIYSNTCRNRVKAYTQGKLREIDVICILQ